MRYLKSAITPLLALIIAFFFGGLLMLLQGADPILAYQSLFYNAFGTSEGFAESLGKATPLIFSGLAVTVGIRAGLFNIGAQGQLISGALAAAWAGHRFTELPTVIHLPLSLIFGISFGAIIGAIAGALKAFRGVHEVITTIMLNSIVLQLAEYISNGPLKEPGQIIARTAPIQESAVIPKISNLPLGFFLGIGVALAVWLLTKKTTLGFSFETVGRNKNAAWYAGVSVKKITVGAMVMAGGLAGLGGAIETQGVIGHFEPAFNSGLGFDGITIALLGRANPLGVIPGAILFGGMRGAGPNMQFDAGVSPDVIELILALVLFFVTAPLIAKWFKIKQANQLTVTSGWGN
jgi:simple sugar transport system permease protein